MGIAEVVGDLMAVAEYSRRWAKGRKAARKLGIVKLPPKRRGELAELAFLKKAIGMGFLVSKPWGDSDRYDFIVDGGGKRWRGRGRPTNIPFGRGGEGGL